MKKQSGPFKLKYKKSAFPFMENFHTKKHGKFKIVKEDESKKITPGGAIGKIGSGLEETGMIKAVKNITTTKPKKTVTRGKLDPPKTSGKRAQQRGKISSPQPKKPQVDDKKIFEFDPTIRNKPDSGISIYGDKKLLNKKSSRPSKKRARRRGAAGTGFFRF
jgi:hypothetical protein